MREQMRVVLFSSPAAGEDVGTTTPPPVVVVVEVVAAATVEQQHMEEEVAMFGWVAVCRVGVPGVMRADAVLRADAIRSWRTLLRAPHAVHVHLTKPLRGTRGVHAKATV